MAKKTSVRIVKNSATAILDVVFLHGLGSSSAATWVSKAGHDVWPLWLASDDINVWVVDYPAPIFAWFAGPGSYTIEQRARNLLEFLFVYPDAKFGARSTVFVTHSLGGLITKGCVLSCLKPTEGLNTECKRLLARTLGVIFLGTPHSGSGLGSLARFIPGATKITRGLARNDKALLDLRTAFATESRNYNVQTFGYAESKDFWGVKVVPESSANHGIDAQQIQLLDRNHSTIARARDEDDDVFLRVGAKIRSWRARARQREQNPPDKDVLTKIATLHYEHSDWSLIEAQAMALLKEIPHQKRDLPPVISGTGAVREIKVSTLDTTLGQTVAHLGVMLPNMVRAKFSPLAVTFGSDTEPEHESDSELKPGTVIETDSGSFGVLTCFAHDASGRLGFLTAGHMFGNGMGEAVYAKVDGNRRLIGRLARLAAGYTINTGGGADGAFVQIDDPTLNVGGNVVSQFFGQADMPIRSVLAHTAIGLGDGVAKSTAQSTMSGEIRATAVSAQIPRLNDEIATLDDLIYVHGGVDESFASAGDSGALVYTPLGDAVGYVIARTDVESGETATIVQPLDLALKALDVTIAPFGADQAAFLRRVKAE